MFFGNQPPKTAPAGRAFVFFGILSLVLSRSLAQTPAYLYEQGTCWVPAYFEVIRPGDKSVFQQVVYRQEGTAEMWDREANNKEGAWITPNCWIFTLNYSDGISSEVRVRQLGFTKEEATGLANKYGKVMGQLPACLRKGTRFINILKSDALYGGNNSLRSIDITVGKQSETYERAGNLEEILFHEATHATFDYLYQKDWAQYSHSDPWFVSKYAADNPQSEDIAETFLLYAAIKFAGARIPSDEIEKVKENLPARVAFFDQLGPDMHPMQVSQANVNSGLFSEKAYYRIVNSWQGDGKSLDILNDGENKNPVLASSADLSGQMWKIKPAGSGTYTLSCKWQGETRVLTVDWEQSPYRLELGSLRGKNGLWKIVSAGSGVYRIVSAEQETLSLDIVNDGQGNKLKLSPSGNYSGQIWKISKLE